jgi:hypothetical protein
VSVNDVVPIDSTSDATFVVNPLSSARSRYRLYGFGSLFIHETVTDVLLLIVREGMVYVAAKGAPETLGNIPSNDHPEAYGSQDIVMEVSVGNIIGRSNIVVLYVVTGDWSAWSLVP